MKKLVSFALIFSLGFSFPFGGGNGGGWPGGGGGSNSSPICVDPSGSCSCDSKIHNVTKTLAEALSKAHNGYEIKICKANYNESDLNITKNNLYIHSDSTATKIYDNSGNPIFNIEANGIILQNLSIDQQSNQMDINVTGNISDLNLSDLNITSEGKGIVLQENIDNNFSDINITSKDRCFENDWSEFHGVIIKNSDFNQTSDGKYAFVEYATNFYDNNFTNLEINSSGYGAYFGYGFKDSNFTNLRIKSDDDPFVVDNGNMDNIRFIDSNISTANGRGISISDGNLTNSYFSDFNISSYWEGIYTYEDINNSTFNNFIINASTGFYSNRYIKTSTFENGEITATQQGMYSDKEFNQSKLYDLNITAVDYGLWFSKNASSGSINDENNLTNLNITQTSDASSIYSAIRFKKKVNNSLFTDINISATERGIWLSTGGYYNNFKDLNINSTKNSGIISSNNIKDNNFTAITIKSDNYGFDLKKISQDNNYTNIYMRVNKKGFKFSTYSINDYFYNIDTNGTKGLDFNISEGDEIRKITAYTTKNEPIYFITIQTSPVKLYDLNLTSTKDNCIYVKTLDDNLSISTINFKMNELNCSDYNGIQVYDDSDKNLTVINTNFLFNSSSSYTSRALIKAKSLDTLYLKNNIFDAYNKIRGVYIKNSLNNFYAYDNNFTDLNDSGIYIKEVNDSLDIEDNNITNGVKWGIYIKSVGDNFNKGQIKKNIIKNNSHYGVDIFYDNENDNANFEIWKNCFYQNHNNSHQAYTYDSKAKYDNGSEGNYWSDWSGSGNYAINPIPIYDHHPLSSCPLLSNENVKYLFNAITKIIYNSASKDWDNNLTTQIINKDFNLYILSKDKNNNNVEANITKVNFNFYSNGNENQCSGSPYASQIICDDSSSNNCPDTNSSGEAEIKNIKVDKAVKCVEVHIEGKDLNSKGATTQESNSTDDFSIRPKDFDIVNIPSKIYAGKEFNLTIQALDNNNKPAQDYNETLIVSQNTNNSPDLNWTDKKSNCITGDLNKTDGGDFKNGETNVTLTYNEVGDLNLTLKEINGSEFASVDEDDTPAKQRFITPITKTITVVPYHFNVNTIVSNFDNNFTYLDNNLTIYSLIDLNITAQNEQNKTTKNYNSKCYAKNVDVNLTPNIFRHNDKLSKEVLYKIFYVDSNSSIYKNKDINFSIGEGNFTTDHNGSAIVKIHLNFERNISNPEDPFEYNITNAEVNDSDVNNTYFSTEGNATFYYGNIYMEDIITPKNDFNISQKFLMYDNNSSDTYKPNSDEILLNWYHNLFNHLKDANISNFVVTKGYVYNKNDELNSVKVKVNDINESLNLNVQRNNSNINFAVIHIIDTNASHLWYSKYGNEYNISQGSSCTNHFCFTVTWPKNEQNSSGVWSGNINGTKADVNESNETLKGVKIFR